jgi:hypothetical protein
MAQPITGLRISSGHAPEYPQESGNRKGNPFRSEGSSTTPKVSAKAAHSGNRHVSRAYVRMRSP